MQSWPIPCSLSGTFTMIGFQRNWIGHVLTYNHNLLTCFQWLPWQSRVPSNSNQFVKRVRIVNGMATEPSPAQTLAAILPTRSAVVCNISRNWAKTILIHQRALAPSREKFLQLWCSWSKAQWHYASRPAMPSIVKQKYLLKWKSWRKQQGQDSIGSVIQH